MEDGINGYILDMELSNLDIDKIVNDIPKNFKYTERCKVSDWTKLLNKKLEAPKKKYKVEALQDYTDKRPELILDHDIKYDQLGNAKIKAGDIYYLADDNRAKEIEKSEFAKVKKI